MRVEIQNDAVTQDRGSDCAHIFDAEMKRPSHQRQNAAAFDQRLRAARRAAIADVAIGDFGSVLRAGLRRHDQFDCVILHVRRDDDLSADSLEIGNLMRDP